MPGIGPGHRACPIYGETDYEIEMVDSRDLVGLRVYVGFTRMDERRRGAGGRGALTRDAQPRTHQQNRSGCHDDAFQGQMAGKLKVSNQPTKTEPPTGTKSQSTDPHSKLFASWLKLMAITDPQARAKGISELRE